MICKFLVMHNCSPAVLGLQDIGKLGLISINYSTKHRQVAEEGSRDNSESLRQTEGGKHGEKVRSRKQEHKTHKIPTILTQQSWVTTTKS